MADRAAAPLPSYEDAVGQAPDPLVIPDALARIRVAHARAGRRIAVLDDDPTGSQCVSGVSLATVPDPQVLAAGLADAGDVCFLLTNTRSMPEAEAAGVAGAGARAFLDLGRQMRAPVEVLTRGDSTLRGHLLAEVDAAAEAYRTVTGHGYDVTVLVPAYLEAGRETAGDVQWARVSGGMAPVGCTEFARDPTFGYAASDLRDFVAEKSGGRIRREQVASVSLTDIRGGGPERVTALLRGQTGGRMVVVNAVAHADLEVVALGLVAALDAGHRVQVRSGPSFVRALAGLPMRPALTAEQVPAAASGQPPARAPGHGLVVVGSHVPLTGRQLAVLRSRRRVVEVGLDVPAVLDPGTRDAHLAACARAAVAGLAHRDVLLVTSRQVCGAGDRQDGLRVARATSAAVARVVHDVVARARPAWILAKGGITSHDVAVHGLGIRRAVVVGQLLPGMVSVLRPVDAPGQVLGMPYVVFAGNVGGETGLADAVEALGPVAAGPGVPAG